MKDFIAILDYEHLDNGIFLNSFAHALSQIQDANGLVIHGESAYTDRLMQTGMMRDDARLRAIKGLNHRLVTLFADHGISTIGLNGYQRSLIGEVDGQLQVDKAQFEQLPRQPLLLLSNLIYTDEQKAPRPLPLPEFAHLLKKALEIDEILIFNLDEKNELIKTDLPDEIPAGKLKSEFAKRVVPKEFRHVPVSFRLISARQFAGYPDLSGTTFIKSGTSG